MRREPEFFAEQELALVYIAKKLKDALALEEVLTRAEFDYLVEPDRYRGGVIFQTERVGAFFYVTPDEEGRVREFLAANGFSPWRPA
jgi:vacuolar-type H+-ATPase subunit E/Vma4